VPGVSAVRELQLAGVDDTNSQTLVEMRGLELPRVAGIMVSLGDAVPVTDLRGAKGTGGPATGGAFVPIPIVPAEC